MKHANLRRWFGLVVFGVAAISTGAFRSTGQRPDDRLARSRQFTRQLLAGMVDSLPATTILDLGGPGDTVLVRWFLDGRRDSPGREWPSSPVSTLEGISSAPAFLARLTTTYGRTPSTVDDGFYQCYYPFCERPHSYEYIGIARSPERPDTTFTIGWLWVRDSFVGGWIIPSRQAFPTTSGSYTTKTTLRLPFDGEWVVLWGGPKPHENYHVALPPLRFAYDFVLDSAGSLHRTTGRSNEDYYCFGRPIVAPAPGRVSVAIDSFSENIPGRSRPGYRGPGNVVVIDHGMGEFSVLAHLRRGSVRVAAAQAIAAGDTVGECGNNGESIVPHLHYQLQLSPQPGQQPIPALFSDFRADTSAMQRGTPTRGQRVSHLRRR